MAEENGAPPGMDPMGVGIPINPMPAIQQQAGGSGPTRTDLGHPHPFNPLDDARARVRIVQRDLPNISSLRNWDPPSIHSALTLHEIGMFQSSAQLCDAIIGDDRVRATLDSRLTGLFGREMRCKPSNDSRAAREVQDAWIECWPRITGRGALQQISAYQILAGWWPAQLVWDFTKKWSTPIVQPWHMRYTYYHWDLRQYIALTMDGQRVIFGGDGTWVLHAPRGEYRAWMWGAIRAIADLWLLRKYALRDMARFSEVHGMPIRKAIAPASSSPDERNDFVQKLGNLGQETTIMVTKGADKAGQDFDLELVEASDAAWQVFPGLRDYCDMGITLALLFQNLTTEVKGGSFAATEAHMDIRQSGIQADNEAWRQTIHEQIAQPFSFINFGDADLAPVTDWDVTPKEDYEGNGRRFYSFGQAIQILRQGGIAFKEGEEENLRAFARSQFGIAIPEGGIEITEPDSGAGGSEPKPTEKTNAPKE